jgi:ATP-dependent helicase/nuclease subunit A
MEQERDEVRIMTVHGAKGLQAPIVFLPDTCMISRAQGPRIFPLDRPSMPPDTVEHLLWAPAGHSKLEALATSMAALERAEREEYHRLLYVAMTRARDRLYICGWEGVKSREKGCWYDLVTQATAGLLIETTGYDGKTVWRYENEPTVTAKRSDESEEQVKAAPLPIWASKPAPPERSRELLTPSGLGALMGDLDSPIVEQPPLGPKALADDRRFARGRLTHTLLQHLPQIAPEEQERAARAFVAARGHDLSEDLREEIVSESLAIAQSPIFAPLFQPGSLGEVPIVARFPKGDLSGQIDRLAVLDDALLVLDYKTNRPPPETPEEVALAYVAQLASYRAALRLMFPGRALRAALVWTDGPKLMEIPSNLLDRAERRILDGGCQP